MVAGSSPARGATFPTLIRFGWRTALFWPVLRRLDSLKKFDAHAIRRTRKIPATQDSPSAPPKRPALSAPRIAAYSEPNVRRRPPIFNCQRAARTAIAALANHSGKIGTSVAGFRGRKGVFAFANSRIWGNACNMRPRAIAKISPPRLTITLAKRPPCSQRQRVYFR